MISFDFEYYRPATVEDAADIFMDLHKHNKNPLYYGGGTEIITMARLNKINTGAVIDIKEIPECRDIKVNENKIIIGAAATLTEISEANIFPLLNKVLKNLADHTSRCKITIGGNICGKIPYREGVMPFMLCDSSLEIFGHDGFKTVNINSIFNETLKLHKGEFITRIITDKKYASMPYMAIKKTRSEKVDYPLISVAALKDGNKVKAAFSGVCNYPFVLDKINSKSYESSFPDSVITDILGSAEYRSFVLKNVVKDIMNNLEEPCIN